MSIPGQPPRRNPYRDPSAYWPDGFRPGSVPRSADPDGLLAEDGLPADGRRGGEPAPRPGPAPSPDAQRAPRPARARKPVSRLATVLGGVSLGFGLFALMLGLVPYIGPVLAAAPLAIAVLAGWGGLARARARAARYPATAFTGLGLSLLHIVLMFVG